MTVRTDEPGPEMTMLVDRSGKAFDKVIVPVTEGANVIVSWAASRLACSIAARSVPGPVSPVLDTAIVESIARLSSDSTIQGVMRCRGETGPQRFRPADSNQTAWC